MGGRVGKRAGAEIKCPASLGERRGDMQPVAPPLRSPQTPLSVTAVPEAETISIEPFWPITS